MAVRLTRRIADGSYVVNEKPELPGENSIEYKNMIINRCGQLEELFDQIKYMVYGIW